MIIENLLQDLDLYYKEEKSATQLFKNVPYLKIKPKHFDIHYLPKAKRFEIGLGRLNDEFSKEEKLFTLTHEICHIAQRLNFKKNLKYTNLRLGFQVDKVKALKNEGEVIGLQYAIYNHMSWCTNIFNWLPFNGGGEIIRPIKIADTNKTIEDFNNLLIEKINIIRGF